MSEPDAGEIAHAPPAPAFDADALIAALRAAGADRFDPVRLRYLDALAKRASARRGNVRSLLDAKLALALAAFRERFELARREAEDALALGERQYPHAADDLRRRVAAGDFRGMRRQVAALRAGEHCASLGALVGQLEQPSPETAGAPSAAPPAGRAELKAIRNFRNTWSKLSVGKQVAKALEQAPKNAGPINSHMLVLRSLALMRDISPDYLNRFMTYADTLLRLDQGGKEKPAPPKKPAAARTAKK